MKAQLKSMFFDQNQLTLLCLAKVVRTFGFAAVSIILPLYLLQCQFSTFEVGLVLTATLVEDALASILIAHYATRIGFKKVLLFCCALILLGGVLLAFNPTKSIVFVAVILAIVSPAGYEGGPFSSIEQTLVAEHVSQRNLTKSFSFYNLAGFAGAALGALAAGTCVSLHPANQSQFAYATIFGAYAFCGILMGLIYLLLKNNKAESKTKTAENSKHFTQEPAQRHARKLSQKLEQDLAPTSQGETSSSSSSQSNARIWQLAGLQSLDAFGGGFVVQSMITLWFYQRHHVGAEFLGPVFFCCNIIAAASFLLAPLIVRRIGLLKTMVFTHLPCSISLCLMPFLPTAWMAAALLLARSAFSSMDIPVRQAYTMVVVDEADRVKASAIITASRSLTQAVAPLCSGFLAGNIISGGIFIWAGLCKSVYDLGLYACFKGVSPGKRREPGEQSAQEFPKNDKTELPCPERKERPTVKTELLS